MVKFLKQSVVLSAVPEHTIVILPELYSALLQVILVFGLFQSCKAKSTPVAPGMWLCFRDTHSTQHIYASTKLNVRETWPLFSELNFARLLIGSWMWTPGTYLLLFRKLVYRQYLQVSGQTQCLLQTFQYICIFAWNCIPYIKHKILSPNSYIMYLYLLQKTPICFGYISWSYSSSYKFGRRVQWIWQHVIDSKQRNVIRIYW
jgi:hypothetical protein